MGLCRRILESPLKHLEEIGIDRMLASLTGDVRHGLPGDQRRARAGGQPRDPRLRGGLPGFAFAQPWRAAWCSAVLGIASYWYSSRWASEYVDRCAAGPGRPAATRPAG